MRKGTFGEFEKAGEDDEDPIHKLESPVGGAVFWACDANGAAR